CFASSFFFVCSAALRVVHSFLLGALPIFGVRQGRRIEVVGAAVAVPVVIGAVAVAVGVLAQGRGAVVVVVGVAPVPIVGPVGVLDRNVRPRDAAHGGTADRVLCIIETIAG